MRVRLGYVAISKTLLESYCHTLTYTNFQKLSDEQKKEKWTSIVTENLKNLKKILQYNVENNIHFFRISQTLIPLATHKEMTFDYIKPFQKDWENIGAYIKKNKIRVDFHPDQFCLLNSAKEDYFEVALRILTYIKNISDAMNIPCKIILHVGSREGGKDEALMRFKRNFQKLPTDIQKRIVLENDDKSYTVSDTLNLCRELHIPMVLDVLHHYCNHGKEKLETYFPLILDTWKDEELPPKIHFSSSLNQKHKWYHSDYIAWKDFFKFYSLLEKSNQDIDIMIEAKAKDEALLRLRRQIKMYLKNSNIHFE